MRHSCRFHASFFRNLGSAGWSPIFLLFLWVQPVETQFFQEFWVQPAELTFFTKVEFSRLYSNFFRPPNFDFLLYIFCFEFSRLNSSFFSSSSSVGVKSVGVIFFFEFIQCRCKKCRCVSRLISKQKMYNKKSKFGGVQPTPTLFVYFLCSYTLVWSVGVGWTQKKWKKCVFGQIRCCLLLCQEEIRAHMIFWIFFWMKTQKVFKKHKGGLFSKKERFILHENTDWFAYASIWSIIVSITKFCSPAKSLALGTRNHFWDYARACNNCVQMRANACTKWAQ